MWKLNKILFIYSREWFTKAREKSLTHESNYSILLLRFDTRNTRNRLLEKKNFFIISKKWFMMRNLSQQPLSRAPISLRLVKLAGASIRLRKVMIYTQQKKIITCLTRESSVEEERRKKSLNHLSHFHFHTPPLVSWILCMLFNGDDDGGKREIIFLSFLLGIPRIYFG